MKNQKFSFDFDNIFSTGSLSPTLTNKTTVSFPNFLVCPISREVFFSLIDEIIRVGKVNHHYGLYRNFRRKLSMSET